jgi:peptide/nickel transport system substrate-binding protein
VASAIDRENFLKVYPPRAATAGTTIMSPTTAGFRAFNAYDGGPTGNLEKAREVLGGRTVPLVLGYPNTPRYQKIAAFLKTNLDPAGFRVDPQPIDVDQYYSTIGKRNNPYDVYIAGWGSDWPSGATIIPPLFDGRQIQAEGNQNLSYLDEAEVNARIDQIMADTDLQRAASAWADLDRELMERFAPIVPLTYERNFSLIGSRVGGAYLSRAHGATALVGIFVK